jgi:hypothetical protein
MSELVGRFGRMHVETRLLAVEPRSLRERV